MADTIVAKATADGQGAIGIVRLSGPDAVAVAEAFVASAVPLGRAPARQAMRAKAKEADDAPIDDVVVTVWRAPASYTGEDMVELSAHGSPYVLERLVARALECGARGARPGEFTFRAFRGGKLDLTQAEAVAALIRSRTKTAHRAAANQLSGGLSDRVKALRGGVLDLLARLEAHLDHGEDGVPLVGDAESDAAFAGLETSLARLQADVARGRLAHEGVRVAIVGPPNAGKSSLLNALLGRERAIVLDEPGTTRDTLEEPVDLGGLSAVLVDTAGLREHALDTAEQVGMERTHQAVDRADAVLCVVDRSAAFDEAQAAVLRDVVRRSRSAGALGEILVLNKADVAAHPSAADRAGFSDVVEVSARTGHGLDELVRQVGRIAGAPETGTGEPLLAANARHAEALRRAGDALSRGRALRAQEEVAAECLRDAAARLAEITGDASGDEVLDRIFSTFCIGK